MSNLKKVTPKVEKLKVEKTKGVTNIVEVIKAHDGLEVGMCFVPDKSMALKMISLGFWKWKE